jgi:hypothetical protein
MAFCCTADCQSADRSVHRWVSGLPIRRFARLCGTCPASGNLSECAELAGAVAERRLEGSRGLQPTVEDKPKFISRRGATPEIGEGCIQASLRDACGWAAPEPWGQTHGYHQRTAPRCFNAGSRCDVGFGSAGLQLAITLTSSRQCVETMGASGCPQRSRLEIHDWFAGGIWIGPADLGLAALEQSLSPLPKQPKSAWCPPALGAVGSPGLCTPAGRDATSANRRDKQP